MDFALTAEQQDRSTRPVHSPERLAPGYQARERAGLIEKEVRLEMGAKGSSPRRSPSNWAAAA